MLRMFIKNKMINKSGKKIMIKFIPVSRPFKANRGRRVGGKPWSPYLYPLMVTTLEVIVDTWREKTCTARALHALHHFTLA